jgi:hypothetical protein
MALNKDLLLVVAAGFVVAGVALVSIPVGLIVAGVCVALGWFLTQEA